MGSISEPLNGSPIHLTAKRSSPITHTGPTIYSRDFAYVNNGPIVVVPARVVRADILTSTAKTFAGLLSGPTVDIRVGRDRKHWSLHRNLLCHHSSYFETEPRLDGETETNGTKHFQLDLPDDDPVGFELLVKWLYQGQLEDASEMSDEAKYDYAVACHKLYLLCERFDMIRLKNISMDQYRQCLNESQLVPDADEVNEIYRASPVGSPFRSLMIKIAARQIMDPEVNRNAEAYRKCFENNPDFAVEMVNAIRSMSGGMLFEDPTFGSQCTYHDHDDVSGCQLEGKGKARATKTGAVNGQGPPMTTSNAAQSIGNLQIPLAEPLAERRTPRKLNTPKRAPAAARRSTAGGRDTAQPTSANSLTGLSTDTPEQSRQTAHANEKLAIQANIRSTRVPSNVPPKLEKRAPGSSSASASQTPLITIRKKLPLHDDFMGMASPFSPTDAGSTVQYSATMRIPNGDSAVSQPNTVSDSSIMRGDQGLTVNVHGITFNPAFKSPSLGKGNRPLSRARSAKAAHLNDGIANDNNAIARTQTRATGDHTSRFNRIYSDNDADLEKESTASNHSRKRKMQDRAPKKTRRHLKSVSPTVPGTPNGAVRPTLVGSSTSRSSNISHATSRTASIASGPRKLSRVSSIVKVRNGKGGITSIDGKSAAAMHSISSGQTQSFVSIHDSNGIPQQPHLERAAFRLPCLWSYYTVCDCGDKIQNRCHVL